MQRIALSEKGRRDRIAILSGWLSATITDPNFKKQYFRNQSYYYLVGEYDLNDHIRSLLNKEIRRRYGFSNTTTYDYAKIVVLQNEELIKKVYIDLEAYASKLNNERKNH